MRLAVEKIQQGILHADRDARDAALFYFCSYQDQNPQIAHQLIAAIEKYGRDDAVSLDVIPDELPLDDEAIRWLIGQLSVSDIPQNDESVQYLGALSLLLCQADITQLQGHMTEIDAAKRIDPGVLKYIHQRITALEKDAKQCWDELEAFAKDNAAVSDANSVDLEVPYVLLEAITRGGKRYSKRIMKLLDLPVDESDDAPAPWLRTFASMLAGELRMDSAIEPLVVGLKADVEWLNEECMQALAKIGSDEVVAALEAEFVEAPYHFRLYAAGVLERIHSDAAVDACLRLIEREENALVQIYLGQAVLASFPEQAIDPVRQLVVSGEVNEDLLQLRSDLMVACKLMDKNLPEIEQWQAEAEQDAQFSSQFYNPEFPVTESTGGAVATQAVSVKQPSTLPKRLFQVNKVGRNQPCPCGSGKKYKKCCLHK